MQEQLPTNPNELAERNFCKYLVPPSFELIDKVIRKSRLKTYTRFERTYNMAKESIKTYKKGRSPLPRKYWHLFYEFDTLRKLSAKLKSGVNEVGNSVGQKITESNVKNVYKQRYAV